MSGIYNLSLKTTPVTVVALAEAVRVLEGNPTRTYLLLQNTGTGDATFGTSSSVVANVGFVSLDPSGSGSGGQGGTQEFKNQIPTNEIWVYSTAGTTVTVTEGGN